MRSDSEQIPQSSEEEAMWINAAGGEEIEEQGQLHATRRDAFLLLIPQQWFPACRPFPPTYIECTLCLQSYEVRAYAL
jgi:hypothetical protein